MVSREIIHKWPSIWCIIGLFCVKLSNKLSPILLVSGNNGIPLFGMMQNDPQFWLFFMGFLLGLPQELCSAKGSPWQGLLRLVIGHAKHAIPLGGVESPWAQHPRAVHVIHTSHIVSHCSLASERFKGSSSLVFFCTLHKLQHSADSPFHFAFR